MPPSTQKRVSNSTGYPYISPWLMFPKDNTYNFVDPVHDNEAYRVSFCESVQGATTHYQKDGWLLMSKKRKVFFCNPFTREIIRLPDLPDGYNISIICFEFSPITPGCMVFAVDQFAPMELGILIIMRSGDIWLPIDFPYTNVKKLMPLHGTAPILYKNGFYCVYCDGTLGVYDTMKNGGWSVLEKPKKIFKNDMHPNLLVECGGDLLLVKLGHLGAAVRIFRLDFSVMEWVKVETLGKYMLFISETSCLSSIAPNSRMEYMMCFPRVYLNGEGILLYSLETGSYHSSSSAENSLNIFYETEGWLSNCTWIQPNWSKCTQQELDWLKIIE
ncbi:F-box/kelch-repeat protein At1g57790-like [Papaver somniferum]|uniref:F-box/kelch-repeat protein At1g57790-like n=1 Tax=Papaver somniferum TaxID=3469 RepID=UPI000E6F624A|nr:F-box/kelch-repeat protein At1g57790-like [Papaver somniferum]